MTATATGLTPSSEYELLLDAIAPLDRPRTDYRAWDERRWGQTLRIADWHRLSPVLFCHLGSGRDADPRSDGDAPHASGSESPPAVLSALERAYLASAARAMFISAAVRRVVGALTEADVPVMLLKGAALVKTVYPDPAQREMLDLDVLVPGERVNTAQDALAPLGYRPKPAGEDGQPSTQLELEGHHGPPLVGEEQLIAVELHYHVTIAGEGARFEIDDFWQRARPAVGGGHPVGGSSAASEHLLPSPEDLLLHVCLHFTRNRLGGSHQHRHTGGALAQICDIARIVEHEPVDWDALAASTRRYQLDTRVFLALLAARELGVPIPDDPLTELEPEGFDRALGRRLVALRVLRGGDHLPVRTLKWMFAPSREVLSRGWNADSTATMSLARAYVRRARARAPLARSALRQPWLFVQDRRLGDQIRALEDRV